MAQFVILKERLEEYNREWAISIYGVVYEGFYEHIDCERFDTEKERDGRYLELLNDGFYSLKQQQELQKQYKS
jgi:hypothetical protein